MQLNNLQPKNKTKNKKRIGRGGARGTYSGKGIKGQKARAGKRIRPEIRDAIKKIPKKRGASAKRFAVKPVIVNFDLLDKDYKSGDIVSPATLTKKNVINNKGRKLPKVKILARGSLKKKLIIENCDISETASKLIIKAGGSVKQK